MIVLLKLSPCGEGRYKLVNHPYAMQNAMENQDLAAHSEESKGSCSNKKVKIGVDAH